jgi:hypothetical protein
MKIKTGTIITTRLANISPHWIPKGVINSVTATGRVLDLAPVKKRAIRNSFQLKIKVMIITDMRPGILIGNTIFGITLNQVQPSTRAASSNSRGNCRKNGTSIQITNAKFIAT